MNAQQTSWREALQVYAKPAALRMFFLGFASGLPLLLVLGTLSFWLREAGIELHVIVMVTWFGLAYGFKWVWAPLVDRLPIPILSRLMGRRRSWLILSQCMVAVSLLAMAFCDPKQALQPMVIFTLITAFASATQDITLDAYRIECAPAHEQAALAATYQTGYRLAMIWAGAGSLALAAFFADGNLTYDQSAWKAAYSIMATSMLVGIVTVFLSPEPKTEVSLQRGALSAERLSQYLQKYPNHSHRRAQLSVWFY